MEKNYCVCCGNTQYTILFRGPDRLTGLPGIFTFVRCTNCGLCYQHPQPTWSQLEPYYQGNYSAYTSVIQDDPSGVGRMIRRIGGWKQRRYVERFASHGSLLDVGCGTGLFLAEMQRTRCWQLMGIEPTHSAAAYVRNRLGIHVVEDVFEDVNFTTESQDVITLWHVLEHVISPQKTLRKVWGILKPGGYFIFSVPNYESLSRWLFGRFWVGWDLPRHLFVFPSPVLKHLLEQHGFRVIHTNCFLITYASLGHSLTFWAQSWPVSFQRVARWLQSVYYTPVTHGILYPFQIAVERMRLATVATWAVQKVST